MAAPALAEAAAMLAGKNQVNAHERTNQHAEQHDCERCGAPPAPSDREARFEQARVEYPNYQRPRFLGLPRPEMSPGRVGPDCAADDREAQHHETPSQQVIVDSVEFFEARRTVAYGTEPAL